MMEFLKNLFLVSLLIVTTSGKLHSQKANYFGLNVTLENSSGTFRPGMGILFERSFTKRSGFETGIYYRTFLQDGFVTFNSGTGSSIVAFTVSERYLSIPVLYKFYTRIVNVSAGPTFDFFTGWKQKNKSAQLNVNAYSIDPSLSVGFMAKISRRFNLTEQFFLEPEVRINPIISLDRSYVGIGVAGKYKL